MEAITIRLGGVPVAKGRPRIGRLANGRPVAFTPSHTRQYENQLRYAAHAVMQSREPLQGPLEMIVTADLPLLRSWSDKKRRQALRGELLPTTRPDVDNYAKAAADALNTIVFADDSQIVTMIVHKRYSATPGLTIEVKPIVLMGRDIPLLTIDDLRRRALA